MTTFAVLVGNRGFFPGELCEQGRRAVLGALKAGGIDAVALGQKETKFGAVGTLADAKKCAEPFRANRDRIDGILVTLPNFGDERSIADTLRFAGLDVPVLVHAFADEPGRMGIEHRRDGFCGKMSACNALAQYGIRCSLTAVVSKLKIPRESLARMAKFAVVLEQHVAEHELAGTALQCWTSLEENFGIVPCTVMSMLAARSAGSGPTARSGAESGPWTSPIAGCPRTMRRAGSGRTSARGRSPATRSRRSAGSAWRKSPACRACCATSAAAGTSTTWRSIPRASRGWSRKPLSATLAGKCIITIAPRRGTNRWRTTR